MKPWHIIERATGPQGEPFELAHRDGEYVIRVNGRVLMSSRQHGSEEAMADVLAMGTGRGPKGQVLVGGLGMGFTLRAVLDRLDAREAVEVAEVVPAVVAWNRGVLGPLAGRPLEDPRVVLVPGDVHDVIAKSRERYRAILLDVDNGPEAAALSANERLYSRLGVERLARALRGGGSVVIWSASRDPRFEGRLRDAGLSVVRRERGSRGVRRGAAHTLFVATCPSRRSS